MVSVSQTFKAELLCPNCGERDSDVTDSRGVADKSLIRRRRSCKSCGERWTTVEANMADLDEIIRKARCFDVVAKQCASMTSTDAGGTT